MREASQPEQNLGGWHSCRMSAPARLLQLSQYANCYWIAKCRYFGVVDSQSVSHLLYYLLLVRKHFYEISQLKS